MIFYDEELGITFKDEAVIYKDYLIECLEAVIDPELGIDVANLGLIYELMMDVSGKLTVTMTLTTMGCPLADYIDSDIRYQLAKFDKIKEIDVIITFNPAWDIRRLSKFARIALGVPNEAVEQWG